MLQLFYIVGQETGGINFAIIAREPGRSREFRTAIGTFQSN
jgi:hypothetical protein